MNNSIGKKETLRYNLLKYPGFLLLKLFDTLVGWVSPNQVFYDTKDFAFTEQLEKSWETIQQECLEVLGEGNIPNIQDFFQEQGKITEEDTWKSYLFLFFGYEFEEHARKCPETAKFIKTIPGVSSAMFSVLAPGKKLTPHKGVYKGVLRYHLGLVIPDNENLCSLRVNGEERNWYPGKSLIFDDTYLHEACNDSTEVRVVLFVDFIRELPFPLNIINKGIFSLMKQSPFVQNTIKELQKIEGLTIKEVDIQF